MEIFYRVVISTFHMASSHCFLIEILVSSSNNDMHSNLSFVLNWDQRFYTHFKLSKAHTLFLIQLRALTGIFTSLCKQRKRSRKKPRCLRRKTKNRLLRNLSRPRIMSYPAQIAFLSLFHYQRSKTSRKSETYEKAGTKQVNPLETRQLYCSYRRMQAARPRPKAKPPWLTYVFCLDHLHGFHN